MLELLKKRRSIRKYKSDKIEKEKIDKMLKAALLSPSSRNKKPWEFIVVDDEKIINQLSNAKVSGSSFVKDAPLAIVIIADKTKTEAWIEDTSIAAIIIQLEAEELGLGSCWIQIRDRKHNENIMSEDYLKDIINIPNNYRAEAIISIGYPDENKKSYDDSDCDFDKVHWNKFKD